MPVPTITIEPRGSIEAAVNAAAPGDTILVKSGTYAGALRFTASGTLDAPITIKAEHKGGVVLDGQNEVEATLTINGSHLVLDGFDIRGGRESGITIYKTSHLRLQNSEIHDNGTIGIANLFGQDGIYIEDSSQITIDSNVIHDNGNNIDGSNRYFALDHGIYVGTYGPGVSGIYIYNNVFFSHGFGYHVQVYAGGKSFAVSKDVHIVNNTFDTGHVQAVGQVVVGGTSVEGLLIQNNIFNNYFGGGAVYLYSGITNSTITIKNNLSSGGIVFTKDGAAYTATSNLVNSGAKFTNGMPNGRDYHIGADSPARNSGASYPSLTTDHDKNPRGIDGVWDIGAFEFKDDQHR